MRRAVAAVVVVVSLAGCAGEPPRRRTPPRSVGHGSVEEVVTALARERLPCSDPRPAPLTGFEQALTCSIGSARVTIVHFVSVAQSHEYEQSVRTAGDHGVFADTWAATVPTQRLAKRIAEAIESRSYA